ncbi:MAG TPA: response regulator transcription factor [Gemmatimonadales bacterium]
MHLLVVEDDEKAARFLRQGLEEEGHAVDVAVDGEEGFRLASSVTYDVIILDIMLPGRDGFEVTAALRASGRATPILAVTARDTSADVVRGLDAGADDYITKPFDFDELVARVRALGRRTGPATAQSGLRVGDLELDRVRRIARRGERTIELAPREFRLLEHLALHAGQVQTRAGLLEMVWDITFDPGTNVVDAHVSNLRKKLEEGGAPRIVHTVRGSGYVLRVDDS